MSGDAESRTDSACFQIVRIDFTLRKKDRNDEPLGGLPSHALRDNPPMQPATPAATILSAKRTWPERLFGRWWRRQSAARQDRYATFGPLVSVLLFLAAIILAFWYLRNEEFEREQ